MKIVDDALVQVQPRRMNTTSTCGTDEEDDGGEERGRGDKYRDYGTDIARR